MSESESEVPEGAAVFPEIPAELGIHPLLLGVLHSVVFLEGTDQALLNPDAAEEAMHYIAEYLQRLEGKDLVRVKEDMATLNAFARQEEWPRVMLEFLADFLKAFGVR